MLQIKSIKIDNGVVFCDGENIQFNFMGEDWRDFHLMQDIIRKFVTEHFGKKCTFGYILNGRNQIVNRKSVFKYPPNTPITIVAEPDEKRTFGDDYRYMMITWLKTWPTNKVIFENKNQVDEPVGDK